MPKKKKKKPTLPVGTENGFSCSIPVFLLGKHMGLVTRWKMQKMSNQSQWESVREDDLRVPQVQKSQDCSECWTANKNVYQTLIYILLHNSKPY